MDLDGALQSSDSPPAVKAPPPPKSEAASPPLPVSVAAPPAGLSERRQPPLPEAVVMSGFSEDAKRGKPPARRSGRPVAIVVLLLVAAAAGIGYLIWNLKRQAVAPQALRVRIMTPTPTAVYRWFSGRGQVTDYETTTVAFANPGRLAELLPAGTEVAAGDVVGKLQGASGLETLLAHDRSRVGFYKQLRDSMRAAGNSAELRLAEAHLTEKQKLVDMAVAGLSKFTVRGDRARRGGRDAGQGRNAGRAGRAGRAREGASPARRVRAGRRRADDAGQDGFLPRRGDRTWPARLERSPAARTSNDSRDDGRRLEPARRAGGPPLPRLPAARRRRRPTASKIEIPLPGDVGLVSGQPLRLARRRYDAVFPVPAAGAAHRRRSQGGLDRGPDGTAEHAHRGGRRRRATTRW